MGQSMKGPHPGPLPSDGRGKGVLVCAHPRSYAGIQPIIPLRQLGRGQATLP
jgi:hypothetical protein